MSKTQRGPNDRPARKAEDQAQSNPRLPETDPNLPQAVEWESPEAEENTMIEETPDDV